MPKDNEEAVRVGEERLGSLDGFEEVCFRIGWGTSREPVPLSALQLQTPKPTAYEAFIQHI